MTDYYKIDAMNWSSLKNIATSPKLYRYRAEHPREDTASLLLGRAVHCAILEPDEYASRYVVARGLPCSGVTKKGEPCGKPAMPGATACHLHGGREQVEEMRSSGVDIVTADQGDVVDICACAVREHPDATRLLEGVETEQVVEWEVMGVKAKGRLDGVSRDSVVDLKSCRELARFERDVERDVALAARRNGVAAYMYHGQLAWYRDGAVKAGICDEDAEAYIIAVETSEPYDVGVYRLSPPILDFGRELYERLLSIYRMCQRTGTWPGQCPSVRDIELSRWDTPTEEAF